MSKKILFTETQIKEIIRLYTEEKMGTPSIGEIYNVHKAVINRTLKENGIVLDQPGRRNIGGKSAADKRYYSKNKEKINERIREWSKNNRNNLREYHKVWREENREAVNYKSNKWNKDRKSSDISYKVKTNIRTAFYSCLKERNINKFDRTFNILGYTLMDLMLHLEGQFTDGMSWDNYGQWHIDHIKPMTSFDFNSTNDENFRLCWSLENLQPLWAKDNLSKGDKLFPSLDFHSQKIDNFIDILSRRLDKLSIPYEIINFYDNIPCIKILSSGVIIRLNENSLMGEFNNSYDKNHLLMITTKANESNLKIIQIFSDEWILKRNLVLNKIGHLINLNTQINIGARKCIIKEISIEEKNLFLDKYHIQGHDNSTVKLGAYYNSELVGVMTFKITNYDTDNYELTRYATNHEYRVSGLGSKLLSFFIKKYDVENIISFADRRWTLDSSDNLYIKLGFKLTNILSPDYKYYNRKINNHKRFHKFGFRKKILIKKYNLNPNLTELEMIKELGYDRIWDCGLFKYELDCSNLYK